MQPLHAYLNGHFIEPNDVNEIIGNALIEIHFLLKHYWIQCKGQKGFDSFTANIEQINVLKHGATRASNPYKQQNPHGGPVEVKHTKISMHSAEPYTYAPEGIYYIVYLLTRTKHNNTS